MKFFVLWVAAMLALVAYGVDQRPTREEVERIALEQTCRTLVEAKLVGTCGQK